LQQLFKLDAIFGLESADQSEYFFRYVKVSRRTRPVAFGVVGLFDMGKKGIAKGRKRGVHGQGREKVQRSRHFSI
jgi:hypothetical protein